jgi:membrane fusion protein, heavy metal efflux system
MFEDRFPGSSTINTEDHSVTPPGAIFLWGGVALGLLLLAGLLTRGFGLLGPRRAGAEAPALIHRGDEIIVPAGSRLRSQLVVEAAPERLTSAQLDLPAIVEADPARTAAVLTPLGGRIVTLRVGLGDRVSRGQVLAVIDSPDLAQAYDDFDKAADALTLSTRDLARIEGQAKIGAASARDVDQARSDRTQALAEYTRTRLRLAAIGMPLNDPPSRSSLLIVRSPLAGSVTALSVAPGNMVNDPTQPLMTVADLSTVWATALVAEKDVAAVAKGEDAAVRLTAYPGRTLKGTVAFVSDVLEPDSRRDEVRIALLNPGYRLKPNMYATVTLRAPRREQVVLPAAALLMNNDRMSVFVATAPWTFERRTVVAQLTDGPSVVVVSGLSPGETVVVSGGILLND